MHFVTMINDNNNNLWKRISEHETFEITLFGKLQLITQPRYTKLLPKCLGSKKRDFAINYRELQ